MSWTYKIPKGECLKKEKAFALKKPYKGKFTFGSDLRRAIPKKDIQNSLRLFALSSEKPLPDNFSWRDQPGITKPRNQAGCGCCWSFAISCALGDRYYIKYKKDYKDLPTIHLSPTWLVSTTYGFFSKIYGDDVNGDTTCNLGGDPFSACLFLEMSKDEAKKAGYLDVEPGIKLDQCWPYDIVTEAKQNPDNWKFPDNLSKVNNNEGCWNCADPKLLKNKDKILFKIRRDGVKNLLCMSGRSIDKIQTINAIRKELQTNGPLICGFQIFESFMNYWESLKPTKNKKPEQLNHIYMAPDPKYKYEKSQGGHAVTIVGWGTFPNKNIRYNNGKPIRYWVMRNSWGTNTADGGYGYIAFSTDWQLNTKLEVDVPQSVDFDNNGDPIWQGGMFGVSPGEFPKNYLQYLNATTSVPGKNVVSTSSPGKIVVNQDKKCVCDNKKFSSTFTNINTGGVFGFLLLFILSGVGLLFILHKLWEIYRDRNKL